MWEVIRLGGGPGQLSTVMTASAVGVLVPALLAGVVADRVPQKHILLTVALVELVGDDAGRLPVVGRPQRAVGCWPASPS